MQNILYNENKFKFIKMTELNEVWNMSIVSPAGVICGKARSFEIKTKTKVIQSSLKYAKWFEFELSVDF